jgi:membrane protease YdiL (CAAX protease family)
MNRATSLIRQYPTTIFFILTFILTIPMNVIASFIYDSTQSIPLALPFVVLSTGPLMSALIVSTVVGGKSGLLALLQKITIWRVGLRWYMAALFLQPVLNLAAIYLNVILGASLPTGAAFGTWSALLGAFALRLVNPFDGPMLEELGWRGFAQSQLQKRYSPLSANLILAVLVTIWHLQLIPMGNYEWIEIPGTLAVTILYGWVYNATGGSVLLTLIMHAIESLIWVNFTGADGTRAIALRVLIYAVTAAMVVLFTGKNLGRKETITTQASPEKVAEQPLPSV